MKRDFQHTLIKTLQLEIGEAKAKMTIEKKDTGEEKKGPKRTADSQRKQDDTKVEKKAKN